MKHLCKILTSLAVALGILLPAISTAQQGLIRDKANNGQYKRMVYKQWNDWQPTPETGFLGIPKNFEGWFYWRVIHHPYWDGPDRRPWKTGGVFDKNYASLLVQQGQEKKMKDTVQKMANVALETYASMAGGPLDLPYTVYFKKKFEDVFKEVERAKDLLKRASPSLYNVMSTSVYGKGYEKQVKSIKDRIEAVHNSFVDRGARMVDYFQIVNKAEPVVQKYKAYIWFFIKQKLLSNPTEAQKPYTDTTQNPLLNNDKEIVDYIIQNWDAN